MAEKVTRDEGLRSKFIPMIVNEAKKRGVVTGNATNPAHADGLDDVFYRDDMGTLRRL